MDTNTTKTEQSVNESPANALDQISLLLGEETEDLEAGQEEANEGESESQQQEESEEGAEEKDEQSEEELTWSKALGVDDQQLALDEEGNLKGINVKVDGESSTVNLKELIAGYQLNRHVTQKSQALAEEKREFEQVRTGASKALFEKLQQADQLVEHLTTGLMSEFEAIDWQRLRTENPGEYAARVTEFQNRKARLDQIKGAITEEGGQLTEQQMAERQEQYKAYLQTQYEKVVSNNPQWADAEKLRSDMITMGNFAGSTYGITSKEFSMLNDARHIEILKDAMAYRMGKTVAEKKIQNVPKVQKAAGKPSKPMSKVTQIALNARKAKGYQQRVLQADAVAALLSGEQ